MRRVLLLAAGYNLLWGAFVILFPFALFDWMGVERPSHPAIWQCVGMIVGVYGIGYAIAAFNPLRHWPIVLVGLLGKILGPIGFVDSALIRGTFPVEFGWTIITNDLIWWAPFALILRAAYLRWRNDTDAPPALSEHEALERSHTQHGVTLAELSRGRTLLVVLLRHSGCTFCKEALADLARDRAAIERDGVTLVLVHMGAESSAAATFQRAGLGDVARVSDPQRTLYRALGLRRGTFTQLFGARMLKRGAAAGFAACHWPGKLVGDGFQMPGVFVVRNGVVLRAYRHRDAADRPDYQQLANCPVPIAAPA